MRRSLFFFVLAALLLQMPALAQCPAPPASGCPNYMFVNVPGDPPTLPMAINATINYTIWGGLIGWGNQPGTVSDASIFTAINGWTSLGYQQALDMTYQPSSDLPQSIINNPSQLGGTVQNPQYAIGLGDPTAICPQTLASQLAGNIVMACTVVTPDPATGIIIDAVTVISPTAYDQNGILAYQDPAELEALMTHEAGIALYGFLDCTGANCVNSVTNPYFSLSAPSACDVLKISALTNGAAGCPPPPPPPPPPPAPSAPTGSNTGSSGSSGGDSGGSGGSSGGGSNGDGGSNGGFGVAYPVYLTDVSSTVGTCKCTTIIYYYSDGTQSPPYQNCTCPQQGPC